MAVLDAGAEEVNDLGEAFEVITEASDMVPARKALQAAGPGLRVGRGRVRRLRRGASSTPTGAAKIMRLVDALEDSDDVQNVYTNADIPAEVLAEME